MNEEDELHEFFGTVHSDRQGEHPQKRRRPPQTTGYNGQQRDPALLTTLARHVLRLEEEIKVLKQDHSLVVFLKPGEHNILHHLFQTAKAFQAKQQSNPTWTPGQLPLKTVMAIALFQELGVRLERTCTEEAIATKVQERGWRDPATGWKFQRWNPTLKCLEEDTTQKPLTDHGVKALLLKLTQALAGDTVHRFNATKKLADTVEANTTFLLDLSTRAPQALEARAALLQLQGNAVLQGGGGSIQTRNTPTQPHRQEDQGDTPTVLRLVLWFRLCCGQCTWYKLMELHWAGRTVFLQPYSVHIQHSQST